MAQFERAVVLSNPVCTRAKTVRHRVAELAESSYGRHLEIITTEREREATEDKLRNQLRPGDVLCIAGGDGTVNTAMRSAGETPILPLWGGNGNDLAHMLNGRPTNRPSRLLEQGKVVPVRPIQGDITTSSGSVTELASSYAGFGAGALGALRLNDSVHREKLLYSFAGARLLYEADLLLKSFAAAQPFTIDRDTGKQDIFDITVANGPRIAKFGRLPLRLAEERHFVFEVKEKAVLPIAQRMGALAIGRPTGDYITDGAYEFTLLDNTIAHFDAEPQVLFADTHIAIRQAETPFYAVATVDNP